MALKYGCGQIQISEEICCPIFKKKYQVWVAVAVATFKTFIVKKGLQGQLQTMSVIHLSQGGADLFASQPHTMIVDLCFLLLLYFYWMF